MSCKGCVVFVKDGKPVRLSATDDADKEFERMKSELRTDRMSGTLLLIKGFSLTDVFVSYASEDTVDLKKKAVRAAILRYKKGERKAASRRHKAEY